MSKKTRHADNSKRQQPTQRAQARLPAGNSPAKAGKDSKNKKARDSGPEGGEGR